MRLDGSDRRILFSRVGHAYSVAVVQAAVYWTDWDSQSIWTANITHVDDDDVGDDNAG